MDLLNRQNEKESLEIQATARLLYDRADNIDLIEWIIILLLPILKIIFPNSIILNYIMMFWFFLSFVFDYFIEKNTVSAAELKKGFDYYVYGWSKEINKKLISLSKKHKVKNASFFERQVNNTGTDNPRGVKNWYTKIEENMPQEMAIEKAMKENIYFDKGINNLAYGIIVAFVIFVVILLSVSDLTFYEVLYASFVLFASFTKKLYSTYFNLKRVEKINENIDILLNDKEVDLLYLQTEIDKKRAISRTSNKFIYYFRTKNIHKEVSNL
ncbi:S-4TM family putative pore-forming effector [Ruoffia sp. FAM 26254]|uniref:S-4TM family putative pore-forming effector n=1 Tax=Ruoffia sp. FAM 26254 TaxID=3259518 RepID=UPI00388725C7